MIATRAGAAGLAGTLVLTGLAPLVWGSTYAVTSTFLPPERPMFSALMRVLPAGLLLLAVTRKLPQAQWIPRIFALGSLNIGIVTALLFVAAYRLPGGVAAVLSASAPLFAVGFAVLAGFERLTGRKVLAAVIGLAGVGLVVLKATACLDTLGVLAGLGAAVSRAGGTVMTKQWGRPDGVGPLAMTGWQLTASGLLLLPVAAIVEGAPPALDAPAIGGYLYLGLIGTAVAYALWFRGIAKTNATSVTFLGLLSPLSATVIGWAALGQSLSPLQVLGTAIALGGTLLGQSGTASRATESASEPATGAPGPGSAAS
ncbi:EamA family transporter [Nocardia sp. NEAU-G5]|uniref:EamA family transporter n=1 Tax=Nocardia albiluteola TaxID=2842303 RepID=A0ABS6ASJ6_9NOCA|nr:EamA family transporter [Nocardia albiluteola]MBU3061009.1 EamA family transporter [Nocardia albiluteola]